MKLYVCVHEWQTEYFWFVLSHVFDLALSASWRLVALSIIDVEHAHEHLWSIFRYFGMLHTFKLLYRANRRSDWKMGVERGGGWTRRRTFVDGRRFLQSIRNDGKGYLKKTDTFSGLFPHKIYMSCVSAVRSSFACAFPVFFNNVESYGLNIKHLCHKNETFVFRPLGR